MKKFLLSIFAVLFVFAGVQAQDTATLSFANKAQRTEFSSTKQVWAQNGVTFTNNKASSSNAVADYAGPIRLYAGSNVVVECSLGNITKIEFDCNSGSYATALKNSIGATATASSDKVTMTLDGTSNSFTVEKLTAQVRMDALTVTYTTAGEGGGEPPVVETVATPVITAESTTFNEGESLFVTIATETEDAAIYYTTDGTEPTTASTVYNAPFAITETTTVMAVAVKKDWNNSVVAKATFTAIDPNAETATLSFADKAQRTSFSTTEQVWEQNGVKLTNVKGSSTSNVGDYANPARFYKSSNIKIEASRKISKIEFDCVSNYVISIAGATTDGTKVTVTVSPASTVYEVKGLSAQVRFNSLTVTYADADSSEPAVTAAPTLPASANFENEFEVVITAEDDAAIYYTTDGSDPTTASTEYDAPFTITETTTVKAIAVKDDVVSAVTEAKYTKVRVIDLSDCTIAEAIEAFKNGQTGEATITGYIVGAADGALNKAQFTSETSVESNILIADNADEENVDNCMPIKLASGTVVRNALNLKANKDVYKKKITIKCELEAYFSVAGTQTVKAAGLYWNVSDAGYATLYLGYKAEIPSTVNAYIVEDTNSTHAIMTKVEGIVAANTGLILEGKGEHLFNITSSAATANVAGNLLKGTVVDENITEDAYVLSVGVNGVGLYGAILNQLDGTAWKNNANKAYLPASAVPNKTVAFYGFDWDGTTAIENVEVENEVKAIYDLTGRRVEEITAPGIYIVNGKKVLIK